MNSLCFNNNDLVETINSRLLSREFQLGITETLLEPRSQHTRYTMPLQNSIPTQKCEPILVNLEPGKFKNYNFIPRGQFSNFAKNVNIESILKRQHIALQKFPQAEYVPNSTSDLYNSQLDAENSILYQGSQAEAIFPNLQHQDLVNYNTTSRSNNKMTRLWNNQSRTLY